MMTSNGVAISVSGKLLRIARVRDEPYECLRNANEFVEELKSAKDRPDLFTFMQEITDREPKYLFHREAEALAILPISTYQKWWKKQIRTHTRNHIKKAQNKGVEVRIVPLDDEFVRGVKAIYDEFPLRQGKPFKHYHKELETIKAELSTFPGRSEFIGAFCAGEMIGFVKFVSGNGTAHLMHIISKIADRDKAPTNALLAKAVELCSDRKIPYLHYGIWSARGLGMFKVNHAFERFEIPRYFIPLTLKGRLMLKLGLHRKMTDYLPPEWYQQIVTWRNGWNAFRYRQIINDRAGT
jgi:hypothetical protein